jgi:hypothetical protein
VIVGIFDRLRIQCAFLTYSPFFLAMTSEGSTFPSGNSPSTDTPITGTTQPLTRLAPSIANRESASGPANIAGVKRPALTDEEFDRFSDNTLGMDYNRSTKKVFTSFPDFQDTFPDTELTKDVTDVKGTKKVSKEEYEARIKTFPQYLQDLVWPSDLQIQPVLQSRLWVEPQDNVSDNFRFTNDKGDS